MHALARRAAVLLILAMGAACAAPSPSAPTPTGEPSDVCTVVDELVDRIARDHPDPWAATPEAAFRQAAAALRARLPDLAPEAQVAELMRLVALIGAGGANGHFVALPDAPPGSHRLPIGFHLFADGLYLVEADAAHAELVGAAVESVNGVPVDEALDRLRPLVNADNVHTAGWVLPVLLESPTILAGAGIGADPARVTLALRLPDGESREVTVEPSATEPYESLLETFVSLRLPPREGLAWLGEQDTEFWLGPMPEAGAVYAQYNTIWEDSGPYAEALRREVRRSGASRVVLDLRLNPGGENPNFPPLLDALGELEAAGVDLVVLIGRATFSAATALATRIAETTDATFVGEATAGSPTTHANVRPLRLEELPIPMLVWVPTQTSSMGPPDAGSVEPDVAVELRAADYFAGSDPVLEAALSLPLPEAAR